MRLFASILISFILTSLKAQSTYSEFGNITLKDFAPTKYDSAASSVVLFDRGKFKANEVGDGPTMERHMRIKILNKEHFDLWGNFKLGNEISVIFKIKAGTYYLENGKIISTYLEKADIHVDKKSDEQVFGLRNLREGCIVELSFTTQYDRFVIRNWLIQNEAPVLWSEFLFNAGGLTYLIDGGIKPFIYNEKYNENGTFNRWVFKDVPAFKEEKLMHDPIDHYAKIQFWDPEKSWDDVSKNFYIYYKKHKGFIFRPLKRDIDKLLIGIQDSLEQAKAICNYVKDNYLWTEENGFLADDFSKIYDKKAGTTGDLNTMLFYLLESAGFKPQFVLLSTKGSGRIQKKLFSEYQFNYVLSRLMINGKEYFLDATNPSLPFNVIPDSCLVADGLLLTNKTFRWINLQSIQAEKINVNARLTITKDQTLKGTVRIVKQGYDAYEDHKKYKIEGDAQFKASSSPDNSWTIDSTTVINGKDSELPFIVTHYVDLSGYLSGTADKIYLNPFILLALKENPFPDEIRKYPIELPKAIEKNLLVTLTLPPGYKIESLPESQVFSLPDKSISCSFKVTADKDKVVVAFNEVIRKSIFEAAEYDGIRKLYEHVISKQNEPLILIKN
ncbi:MAG TPA: hypothetical protein VL443_18830 [Cyclobacteriaceae bacterium]|nr:hypothetical protein [Cyclobacteriaceae bacterium]